jgi:Tfp pilus assembly protein PilF
MLWAVFPSKMKPANQRVPLRIGTFLLPVLLCNFLCPLVACGQTHAIASNVGRRVEIEVTIRSNTGELLSVPANVKVYLNGTPCDEGSTSTGRTSFIVNDIGKFSVAVEAAGYKPGQGDVIVSEPVKVQLEINLQQESSSNLAPGTGENSILAPRAKEALDKGMQALRDDNLVEAEKDLSQSLKLAPNNPHVLYVQGLLDLKKHQWTKAQSVLEKATQMEPNSARALAALGMSLCNQKKYAEAIPPLEKSLELDPAGGWETHWSLGESYYHSDRFDEALKVSQKAEAQSKGHAPQVDLLVARALTAVGRYEDSARVLRELLSRNDGPEAATARRFLERLSADGKIPRQ